jgi:hypothetical protein
MSGATPTLAPSTPMQDRLTWSKDQTGEQFDTTGRNIDLLVASGKFPPPQKFGSVPRWRVDELRAWTAAGMPPMSEWQWPIPSPAVHLPTRVVQTVLKTGTLPEPEPP